MSKKSKIIIIACIAVILLLGLMCVRLIGDKKPVEEPDLQEKEGIFCTMYDAGNMTEDYFETYRGLKVKKLTTSFGTGKELLECVRKSLHDKKDLKAIYLGMDPAKLWEEADGDHEKWQKELNALSDIMKDNPKTMFEILLPYPQLSYWCKMENYPDKVLEAYALFVESLEHGQNVKIYFPGAEEWLICNPANYIGEFGVNAEISKHIFLATFCDGNHQVNGELMREKLKDLSERIYNQRTAPVAYPDLSGYTVVFIGDSIVGLDRSSASVPEIVGTLSGAATYNLAQGGLTATQVEGKISFLTIVEALEKESVTKLKDEEMEQDLQDFLNRQEKESKLIFVVGYGLNDYFQGIRVRDEANPMNPQTYSGALELGVERLKQKYPEAVIVVMAPTYTSFGSQGSECMSEQGGMLMDYRLAAEEVAAEQGVIFKNQYQDLNINAENEKLYLTDGCHLTQQGKFMYGVNMIEFLGDVFR